MALIAVGMNGRPLLAALVFALLLLAPSARAADPQPPRAGTAPYPRPNSPPSIMLWGEKDLEQWHPPSCTGWTGRSKFVVAAAGSFRFSGAMNQLLARIGAGFALP